MAVLRRLIARRYLLAAAAGLLLWLLPAGAAGKETDFDYDIFLAGDTLALWLDVRPVLTQSKMEDVLAGLRVTIAVTVDVERPRKLFFSKTLATYRTVLAIWRRLTEDTYRLKIIGRSVREYSFKSQLALSDFLADSLVMDVVPADQIRGRGPLRLALTLVSKSHSNDIGDEFAAAEADSARAGGQDGEFFESLLNSFLNLIGFGAVTYHVTTPLFSPGDLPAFPR
jgi:hypothetical protein